MEENIFAGKKCFVIMPFGKKKEKRPDGTEVEIDFDYVYHELIKKAVEAIGVVCDRCDEIIDTGSIHAKMFNGIFNADVAVVDVSFMNPNVYYELGVRHALNKHTTLVIRKNSNQPPPFNISGLNVLGYDIDDDKLDVSRKTIGDYVRKGLEEQKTDSLVHEYIDNLKIERKSPKIGKIEYRTYQILNVPERQIGIVTGDIQEITEIDVWVNPENTDMQMARHFDRGISATIRFMGAVKDESGIVNDDVIANELGTKLAKGARAVAGQVIATGSGELRESNNVKKIFHAASVEGEVGVGYTPIKEVEKCIRNALKKADAKELANEDIQSIVFPLMGTGNAKSNPEEVAKRLIDTAISYMETNKDMKIKKVFFLARNEEDLEICTDILNTHKSIVH